MVLNYNQKICQDTEFLIVHFIYGDTEFLIFDCNILLSKIAPIKNTSCGILVRYVISPMINRGISIMTLKWPHFYCRYRPRLVHLRHNNCGATIDHCDFFVFSQDRCYDNLSHPSIYRKTKNIKLNFLSICHK